MQMVLRSAALYFFVWLVTRTMGRKELSQLSSFDLILLIVMGDLICWESGGHIATVQDPNGGDMKCVESNGDLKVFGLGASSLKVVRNGLSVVPDDMGSRPILCFLQL